MQGVHLYKGGEGRLQAGCPLLFLARWGQVEFGVSRVSTPLYVWFSVHAEGGCRVTSTPRGTGRRVSSTPRGTGCRVSSIPRGTGCRVSSTPRGTGCRVSSTHITFCYSETRCWVYIPVPVSTVQVIYLSFSIVRSKL